MGNISQLVQAGLQALGFRSWVARSFRHPPRKGRALRPARYPRKLDPTAWAVGDVRCLTLRPEEPGASHAVLFPGGAYLVEASYFHGRMARLLAERYGLTVTLVQYPLAPEHSFATTHEAALQAYLKAVEAAPADRYYLMGDSAGGGLALAVLKALRDRGIQPRPAGTVLISPWVDLSLSNPQIESCISRDVMLQLDGLRYAARVYSGGADLDTPGLSPLYGNLSGLGSILLFYGTRELFYPDCRALAEKLAGAPGTEVVSVVGEGQFHDWVIFPLPESRRALHQAALYMGGS